MTEPYEIGVRIASRFREAVDENWLRGVAGRVLAAEGVAAVEVSIVITDDPTVRELNRLYRGEDAPTDVLSFALTENCEDFVLPPDQAPRLGEVVISLPTARRQAKQAGKTVQQEVAWLLVHGLLHLLGYDHAVEEEGQVMRLREASLLAGSDIIR